jgi:LmbE family N-acetylglucosaminyl deacetylase
MPTMQYFQGRAQFMVAVLAVASLTAACTRSPAVPPPGTATESAAGSAASEPAATGSAAAASAPATASAEKCPIAEDPIEPAPPPEPVCNNKELTAYDGLLVFSPHPDDESLAFSGLASAYREQGKRVEVVVVTDGDAFCEACMFWKTGSSRAGTCSAEDLSNFATPAVDSFAEVRRTESTAAAAHLGLPPPTFLGYPDAGIATALRNIADKKPDESLRRSDFSGCKDCRSCNAGYGGGPATKLTAATLLADLRRRIAATSERTLLATTHPLDLHLDHAGLAQLIDQVNREQRKPRAIATAVIHAATPKIMPLSNCHYPAPAASECFCYSERCADADPTWATRQAVKRFHPDWPAELPSDADYGKPSQLCLPERLYRGDQAAKLKAVRSHGTQIGLVRQTGTHPPARMGLMDCTGYLTSFVRRTEVFVLNDPRASPRP